MKLLYDNAQLSLHQIPKWSQKSIFRFPYTDRSPKLMNTRTQDNRPFPSNLTSIFYFFSKCWEENSNGKVQFKITISQWKCVESWSSRLTSMVSHMLLQLTVKAAWILISHVTSYVSNFIFMNVKLNLETDQFHYVKPHSGSWKISKLDNFCK